MLCACLYEYIPTELENYATRSSLRLHERRVRVYVSVYGMDTSINLYDKNTKNQSVGAVEDTLPRGDATVIY